MISWKRLCFIMGWSDEEEMHRNFYESEGLSTLRMADLYSEALGKTVSYQAVCYRLSKYGIVVRSKSGRKEKEPARKIPEVQELPGEALVNNHHQPCVPEVRMCGVGNVPEDQKTAARLKVPVKTYEYFREVLG